MTIRRLHHSPKRRQNRRGQPGRGHPAGAPGHRHAPRPGVGANRAERQHRDLHEQIEHQQAQGTEPSRHGIRREDLRGTWAMEREAQVADPRTKERSEEAKVYGLEAAESIKDRSISLFSRRRRGPAAGGTFLGSPFLEDMRQLGGQDVVFVGAPLDCGTTFRPGTRFGPEALRRISNFGGVYNPERGVMLGECLNMVDAGDIQVIPANIEKSFDQIANAISYITERAVFPIVLGGDHSIGYPDIRGMAPYIDGNIGILHFDRHSDLSENYLDERMHGSPFFHATNIPNAPATNLVQIGIGGWTGSKQGIKVARDRRAAVITIDDVDRYGIERVMEYALEIAWKGAKAIWLSFDIDSVDPAFAPGTGTPEPGGLLPREALKMLRLAAAEGLHGMEVVEVSPPYDVSDITSLLGSRAIMDVLSTLVETGKLGRVPPPPTPEEEAAKPVQEEKQPGG